MNYRKIESGVRLILSEITRPTDQARLSFNEAHEWVCGYLDLSMNEGEEVGDQALAAIEIRHDITSPGYDFSIL